MWKSVEPANKWNSGLIADGTAGATDVDRTEACEAIASDCEAECENYGSCRL
jgi:hypothetical protein